MFESFTLMFILTGVLGAIGIIYMYHQRKKTVETTVVSTVVPTVVIPTSNVSAIISQILPIKGLVDIVISYHFDFMTHLKESIEVGDIKDNYVSGMSSYATSFDGYYIILINTLGQVVLIYNGTSEYDEGGGYCDPEREESGKFLILLNKDVLYMTDFEEKDIICEYKLGVNVDGYQYNNCHYLHGCGDGSFSSMFFSFTGQMEKTNFYKKYIKSEEAKWWDTYCKESQ